MAAAGGNANRQSLYSRQLRELEAYFGAPLVDRSRTPHSLTELGRQVERTARGFMADMEALVQSGQSGRVPLVIGAGESVIQALLIPLLTGSEEARDWKLVFRNLRSEAILAGLRSRRLDIGVAHDSGGHADLKSKRLLRYGVRLITREAKLARLETISWRDLKASSGLALPEGDSQLRVAVESSLPESKAGVPVVMECTSHAQVVEAAMSKGIAGIVPDFIAERARERGLHSLEVLDLKGFVRELRLLWHPAAVEMKPAIERCLRAVAGR